MKGSKFLRLKARLAQEEPAKAETVVTLPTTVESEEVAESVESSFEEVKPTLKKKTIKNA
jgi:hypothetical protein